MSPQVSKINCYVGLDYISKFIFEEIETFDFESLSLIETKNNCCVKTLQSKLKLNLLLSYMLFGTRHLLPRQLQYIKAYS